VAFMVAGGGFELHFGNRFRIRFLRNKVQRLII